VSFLSDKIKAKNFGPQFLQETAFLIQTLFCVVRPNFRPVSHQAWPETGLVWPATPPPPGPAQREGNGPACHVPPSFRPVRPGSACPLLRPGLPSELVLAGWHIGQKKKTGFGLVPVADLTPSFPNRLVNRSSTWVGEWGGGGGSGLFSFSIGRFRDSESSSMSS
jgi:hypothetical protein